MEPASSVIELDFKKRQPKNLPESPVRRRLEDSINSPRASPSKEEIELRLQRAAEKRERMLAEENEKRKESIEERIQRAAEKRERLNEEEEVKRQQLAERLQRANEKRNQLIAEENQRRRESISRVEAALRSISISENIPPQ
jgi:hypothetical protein